MSDNFGELARNGEGGDRIDWPDPTPEMLEDPLFEAIWQAIKTWDINVPGAYGGYCGATGNHARAIMDAIPRVTEVCKNTKCPRGGTSVEVIHHG